MPCPRSSVRSERHRAKVEVAGAIPAVDAILPLCLSSYRASFVNSYSSVQVRPGAPFHGDHDVTAASRPVTAFVPVRIRLVTPISTQGRQSRWSKPGGCEGGHPLPPILIPLAEQSRRRFAKPHMLVRLLHGIPAFAKATARRGNSNDYSRSLTMSCRMA